MCPQLWELTIHIFLKFFSLQLPVLADNLVGDGECVLLVDPVLGELGLVVLAAVAITAAVEGALQKVLTDSLEVEAALAIASTVGVVRRLHRVTLKDDGVPSQD